jgi:hypothetical protein
MALTPMDAEKDSTPRADAVGASPPRCRRCRQVISSAERESFFRRAGLCFWCAHVDAQG